MLNLNNVNEEAYNILNQLSSQPTNSFNLEINLGESNFEEESLSENNEKIVINLIDDEKDEPINKIIKTDNNLNLNINVSNTLNIDEGEFYDNKHILSNTKLSYTIANLPDWQKKSDWDKHIKYALKYIFRLKKFRTNQKEIINAVLSGRNVFVNMPTGGGKSLLFQLPAAISQNVTIVIMPLLSLIHDQIYYLNKIGINCIHIKDDYSFEKNYFYNYFENPKIEERIKIIYLTPEKMFLNDHTKGLLRILYKKNLIDRFVIDEAHCLAQWGKDFRKEYLNLTNLKNEYPDIPILSMTATASYEVRNEIISLLYKDNCLLFRTSYNRPNLFLEVRDKTIFANPLKNLAQFIQSNYPNGSGIIYCGSRKSCESIAQKLKIDYNLKAEYFHSLVSENKKHEIQEKFMKEEIKVLVATIAFGMGINKNNIRYVIHYTLPKSFENYYQEIGRAGRDGQKANTILYFNPNERKTLDFLLAKSGGDNITKSANLRKVDQIIDFCEDKYTCRRILALRYFDEIFSEEKCNKMCDNCLNETEYKVINVTKQAFDIIKFFLFLSESTFKMTTNQSASYLKGLKLDKFKTFGFLLRNDNKYFGLLKELDLSDIMRLIRILIIKKYLNESVEFYYENVCCYIELDINSYEVLNNPNNDFDLIMKFPNKQAKNNFAHKANNTVENKAKEANKDYVRYIGSNSNTGNRKGLINKFDFKVAGSESKLLTGDDNILFGAMVDNPSTINNQINYSNISNTVFTEKKDLASSYLKNKRFNEKDEKEKDETYIEKKFKKSSFI